MAEPHEIGPGSKGGAADPRLRAEALEPGASSASIFIFLLPSSLLFITFSLQVPYFELIYFNLLRTIVHHGG